MKCFEVFLKLDQGGHVIGKSYRQVKAKNRFLAAIKAEEQIEILYGGKILAHAFRINRIPAAQFAFPTAA